MDESEGENSVPEIDPGQLQEKPLLESYDLTSLGTYSDGMALTRAILSGRDLTGIDLLTDYSSLSYVDLSRNNLTDISPLSSTAPRLEVLVLAQNKLDDDSFSAFQGFPALRYLDVSGNKGITSAAPFMGEELVFLSLAGTGVADMYSVAQDSPMLEYLDISNTPTAYLPVGLPRLTTLRARACRLAYPFGWAAGHVTRLSAKRLFYEEFKTRELERIARERAIREQEKAELAERKQREREEKRRKFIEEWEAQQAALVARGKRRHRHRPPTPYSESEPEEESVPEVFESQPLEDDEDDTLTPGRLPSLLCLDMKDARLLTLAGLSRVCPRLRALSVAGSRLGELTGFGDMDIPQTLQKISFSETPFEQITDCKGRMIRLCPGLQCINGELISDDTRDEALRTLCTEQFTYPQPPLQLETPMDEVRKQYDGIFDLTDPPEPTEDEYDGD